MSLSSPVNAVVHIDRYHFVFCCKMQQKTEAPEASGKLSPILNCQLHKKKSCVYDFLVISNSLLDIINTLLCKICHLG